jgi:hypothetical protein
MLTLASYTLLDASTLRPRLVCGMDIPLRKWIVIPEIKDNGMEWLFIIFSLVTTHTL